MARYTGAVCKMCRREGKKLYLKGERCYSNKCAFERRSYAPGQHGQSRKKTSEYGLQLRAKQGRYLLFDLSSTGGTYLNNSPVKTANLKPGDVVRIGKTLLIYNQDVPGTGSNPTTMITPEE